MNEQFSDLEAPDLDFPNNNLQFAYEFFGVCQHSCHPI